MNFLDGQITLLISEYNAREHACRCRHAKRSVFSARILYSIILVFEQQTETKAKLEVPAQCIKSCKEPEYLPGEDMTLLIIGSILLAIILFVLVCFICGVCLKKKQQDEKMRHLTSSGRENFTPSYRTMAFTENLEGTVDSLAKYKRGPTQTTTSPMMPNMPPTYQVIVKSN